MLHTEHNAKRRHENAKCLDANPSKPHIMDVMQLNLNFHVIHTVTKRNKGAEHLQVTKISFAPYKRGKKWLTFGTLHFGKVKNFTISLSSWNIMRAFTHSLDVWAPILEILTPSVIKQRTNEPSYWQKFTNIKQSAIKMLHFRHLKKHIWCARYS